MPPLSKLPPHCIKGALHPHLRCCSLRALEGTWQALLLLLPAAASAARAQQLCARA